MEEGEVPLVLRDPAAPRTWRSLHDAVAYFKAVQQDQANTVPNTFTFLGDHHLLYLGAMSSVDTHQDILCHDIQAGTTQAVLRSGWQYWTAEMTLSKEEQLLRERKRQSTTGITSYVYQEDGNVVMFPQKGSLYRFTIPSIDDVGSIAPTELKTKCEGARIDPRFCPASTAFASFISDGNLFVARCTDGDPEETQLTAVGGRVQAGVPSFIIQEEFGRYTGYWWQPCAAAPQQATPATGAAAAAPSAGASEAAGQKRRRTDAVPADARWRILYEEVDERDVESVSITEYSLSGRPDDFVFPRPGSRNAAIRLKLLEFDAQTVGDNLAAKQLPRPLQDLFPMCEYVVRCGWLPDGQQCWAQLLSRDQTHICLILIPLSAFVAVDAAAVEGVTAESLGIRVILQEKSAVWINVHDNLRFIQGPAGDSDAPLNFVWASERTGFMHLYLAQHKGGDTSMTDMTSGDWCVDPNGIWVDDGGPTLRAYFLGTKHSDLEQHLYSVSVDTAKTQPDAVSDYLQGLAPAAIVFGQPTQLTAKGASHAVAVSLAQSAFVTVNSSLRSAPQCQICRLPDAAASEPPPPTTLVQLNGVTEYRAPELIRFTSKAGHHVNAMVYAPRKEAFPGPRPCVLYVYGGPHVQLVSNAYRGSSHLRHHILSELGFYVVMMDCRGSARRGVEFEGFLKHRMGVNEIEDQVEGLEHVASLPGVSIDRSRVAIHGWSYGGYLSLLGLAQRPDVFKLCLAGAPVTTWEAYDTGYTERYMDTPENNSEGYASGSVLQLVDKFPDTEDRLFVFHGLIDENVHFLHSAMLVDALVKACKPHSVQLYPGERHGIRNLAASEHYETLYLSILHKHL